MASLPCLNCKTDLIFIANSERSHYIQSSVILWAGCIKLVSLNIVINLTSYASCDYAATLV